MNIKRKPTFKEAILPILSMLLILGVGYGKMKLPIQILLLIASFIAAMVGKRLGLTWEDMMDGISEKVNSSLTSIFVMICVGSLIGSWMVSGTIPMMIYYGIQVINPKYLLATAFLVTALISTFTGTSFGSAGTAGVAVMGIAIALNVPLAPVAGAIVAGSVFGDKLSPFSDTTILAPVAAGSELYEHIKHMLFTTGAGTILGLIVYLIIGINTSDSSIASPEKVLMMLTTLDIMFNWNILLLLPPIIILYGAYKKKPTIPTMLLSSTVAALLGILIQNFSIKNVFTAILNGFNVSMVNAVGFDNANVIKEITTLLNRGGMVGMMGTVLLILTTFAFAGIVSKSGSMEVILENIMKYVKSTGDLILSTSLSCILMSIVTGSSYLAILIPGEMFRGLYREKGLHPKNLSRTLEDSGTCVVPLVPWSIAGTYMATTLGVSTLDYLPWAIMCYMSVVFAIIFGYTGLFISKTK
ncbi:MAG: Na+/H+ antiporter NhaC [Sedimentibacter sp.]|uniref:Na+/H+ antiporter NhaC n=1 Tax=Sedimentibacter sp. TaxID=1960295 RepID=UPI0031580FB9